jgi:dTDP-4-amino-4,6-dideoxygalactose transaminase
MGCPVLSDRRDELVERLRSIGIAAKIHWRLPPSIESAFANSRDLSNKMLTLPVYPELTRKDRERMSNMLGSLS